MFNVKETQRTKTYCSVLAQSLESFNMVNLAPYLATDHASINFHANLDFISRKQKIFIKAMLSISLTILWHFK